jgi:hypothetical protein
LEEVDVVATALFAVTRAGAVTAAGAAIFAETVAAFFFLCLVDVVVTAREAVEIKAIAEAITTVRESMDEYAFIKPNSAEGLQPEEPGAFGQTSHFRGAAGISILSCPARAVNRIVRFPNSIRKGP